MEGVVKWFKSKKRYGFIESRGKDYFVHIWDIGEKSQLEKGDKICFEAQQAPKGSKAVKVKKIS